MLPGFGGQYRLYRMAAALDRLRGMPAGTTLSLTKAAQLLGVRDEQLRELLRQYGSAASDRSISATELRRVVQAAFDARRR